MVKTRLVTSNGYWVQRDGNAMLAKRGKRLVSVQMPSSSDCGKYVVHSNNHFMALRIYDDEAIMYIAGKSFSFESVNFLGYLHEPLFFRICSDSWQDREDFYACKVCERVIYGAPMKQNGEAPCHLGCTDI